MANKIDVIYSELHDTFVLTHKRTKFDLGQDGWIAYQAKAILECEGFEEFETYIVRQTGKLLKKVKKDVKVQPFNYSQFFTRG